MEETKKLMMKQTKYKCDKCRRGYLLFKKEVPTGRLSNPVEYFHVCDDTDCDNFEYFDKIYPELKL